MKMEKAQKQLNEAMQNGKGNYTADRTNQLVDATGQAGMGMSQGGQNG